MNKNISYEEFDQKQILDNIGKELEFIRKVEKQLYENKNHTDDVKKLISKRHIEIKKMYLMYENHQ